jgi:branched-subunit amino acid aminotransferase/4-amino-4-deoxychorismate lyase
MTAASRRFPALIDGVIVAPGQPVMVSAFDAGLRTGWGVFTTLRARGAAGPLLERHAARLSADAAAVGIPIESAGIVQATRALLTVERPLDEVVVRITVTAGGPVDADAWPQVATGRASLVVTLHAAPSLPAPPVRAVTHDARRWPGAVKSTSYLPSVLATRDARAAGADVAVLLDGDELLETAEGNLFAILDDELWTPAADARLLAGITRELVLAAADDLGLTVRTAPLRRHDIGQVEALLITSSVSGIRTVLSLDGRALPDGAEQMDAVVALRGRVHPELRAATSASG